MRQIALIAGKELRDGLRNRWVLAITLLLALFALTLSFLGAAPTGSVKVSPLAVTIVSLSSLSIFLLPMIALLLSYDAIIGEWERGTLGLLLAYPVARWQVMLGKFAGHVGILAIATVLGYGTAGVAALLNSGDLANDWRDFAALVTSSVCSARSSSPSAMLSVQWYAIAAWPGAWPSAYGSSSCWSTTWLCSVCSSLIKAACSTKPP